MMCHGWHFAGRAAALLRLPRHVHLQQHALCHAVGRRPPVELVRQRDRIDRVHQREPSGDVLRLIALQVPDQVPGRPPPGGAVDLGERLLHAVLPQIREAGIEGRLHGFQAESLRDRDDRDRRGPTRGCLPPSDFGPYVGQPLGQGRKIHNRAS